VSTQVIKSLLALLHYYNWRKFSVINEEQWQGVARTLVAKANQNNMQVNHHRTLKDRHECCEHKMQCCHSGFWYQVIQETRNRTRSEYSLQYNLSLKIRLFFYCYELVCLFHFVKSPFSDPNKVVYYL
jgi:hypothetical protein